MKQILIISILLLSAFAGDLKARAKDNLSELQNKTERQSGEQTKDKPLKILKKPLAKSVRGCSGNTAVVRLRVTFHSSGKITDAEIIESSGCRGFEANVAEATKKIKFKPAIKNGEAVSVVKVLEYETSLP